MPGTLTRLSDDAAVPVSGPSGPHRYCRRSRWQPPAAARRENSGRRRPCAGGPAPGSAPCGATSAGAASTGGSWQGSPASTANLAGNNALTQTSSTCVCVPRHGLSASGAAPACTGQAALLAHPAAAGMQHQGAATSACTAWPVPCAARCGRLSGSPSVQLKPCRCMPVYAKGTQRSSHKQLLACKAAPLLLARRAGSRRAPAAAWTAARPSGWPRLGRPRQTRCRPSPAATPSSTSRPPPPHCPAGAAARAPRRPSPAGRVHAHVFRAGRSSVRITSRARTVKDGRDA